MKEFRDERSLFERVYDYLEQNPTATNTEIAVSLNADVGVVKTYIGRLKQRGYIDILHEDGQRFISIVKDFNVPDVKPKSYKQEVFYEMIEVYRGDFKKCENFRERTAVGAEIRLLFREM